MIALAAALALQAAAAAEPVYPAQFFRWGELQAHILHGAGRMRDVTVSVAKADAGHGGYLVARKVELQYGAPQPLAWADGRACPALAAMPTTMQPLGGFQIGEAAPMWRPSPDKQGFGEIVVTADGPSYLVDAPAQYAWDKDLRVRLSGGGLTPVGDWVEATLAALAPCWRPAPPDPKPPDAAFEERPGGQRP